MTARPSDTANREERPLVRTLFILGAILLAAASRTLPHPENFAPLTAIALFGAAKLRDRRLAVVTPLVALFLSDLLIQVLHNQGLMVSWGLYRYMWGTYGAILLITLFGFLLRKRPSAAWVGGTTLVSSCFFFLFTNFAVWASGGFYEYTPQPPAGLAGLWLCYVEAIPFFRNTLLGDACYATALFGGFALAQAWLPALRKSAAPEAVGVVG